MGHSVVEWVKGLLNGSHGGQMGHRMVGWVKGEVGHLLMGVKRQHLCNNP